MSLTAAHLKTVHELAARIKRPLKFMEVCGTHTLSACRSGLRWLLPENISLLAGPGCPVCVTPAAYIDQAIALSRQPGVTIATFGDLLRVPGTSSLEQERARGARVRVVYSAADALQEAAQHPQQEVVFMGVGFETTAPTVAWTIQEAQAQGWRNYSVLCAHKTMPAAMQALLDSDAVQLDGFLCPGHGSTIIGSRPYAALCRQYAIPCVVAGFEASDMLAAIELLLRQVLAGRAAVEIQYKRGVNASGNPAAQAILSRVFEACPSEWRGLGTIPRSGLRLRRRFRDYDAARRWPELELPPPSRPTGCICGDILRGVRTPPECPLFAQACRPATPLGACMVSSEGACAAYYRYAGPEPRRSASKRRELDHNEA